MKSRMSERARTDAWEPQGSNPLGPPGPELGVRYGVPGTSTGDEFSLPGGTITVQDAFTALGYGVLDSAMVATAAYCLVK